MSSSISTRASRPLVLSALVLLAACGGSRAAVPAQELGAAARTAHAAPAQPEAPALSCGSEANPCLIDEVLVVVSRGDSAKTLN